MTNAFQNFKQQPLTPREIPIFGIQIPRRTLELGDSRLFGIGCWDLGLNQLFCSASLRMTMSFYASTF
jgi:hypothetical protein